MATGWNATPRVEKMDTRKTCQKAVTRSALTGAPLHARRIEDGYVGRLEHTCGYVDPRTAYSPARLEARERRVESRKRSALPYQPKSSTSSTGSFYGRQREPFETSGSVDPRTAYSPARLEARERRVESQQRSALPYQPKSSTSSTGSFYRRVQDLYETSDLALTEAQARRRRRRRREVSFTDQAWIEDHSRRRREVYFTGRERTEAPARTRQVLFTDTIAEDLLKGKVPCNRTRIMVVGPAGVGKTSFINRLTNQSFDQEEKSTVGTVNTHTTSQWKLEPVPRDELAECLARRHNAKKRKVLRATCPSSLQTTERVSSLRVEDEPAEPTEGIEEVKEYAKGISPERIHSVSSSANDIIYSIWDFGGQEIYYITHPLFLSWRSLYIAVFPLHEVMTENALREEGQLEGCPTKNYRTMLDLMHFWMMSIYIHAVPPHSMEERADHDPKILLVGTFCNDDKSKSNKDMSISKLLDMVTDKPYGSQVISSVVEVDNKSSSDDEISQIQKQIDVLIKDANYLKEELPIKWRIFVDKTKDLHQDTLKLTEARKIMSKIGICDDKEVQDVLRYCHDAGHLIYHQGCELIILHPEVLNSFVSNIITVITRQKLHGELEVHWRRLQKKGVLSMHLIKAVWKQHKGKDDELDMVIDMMIKFDLMCEIQDTQGVNQGRRFFVPCRSSPTLHLEEQHGSDDEFQFIIDFEHLLPDGFLHRLYVRMAKWAMDQGGPDDPSFHCREMLFYIDERHRVIMSNDIEGGDAHKIKVTIYAISAEDHPDPNAKVNFQCQFMKYLDDTLDVLKKTWARRITYAVGIECPKCRKTVPLAKFRRHKERVACDNCSSSILVSKVPQCMRHSSVDAKTTGATVILDDARRRTVESAQGSVDPPRQTSKRSASGSLHGQQAFYDIYLVYSEDTEHVRNVKDIIHENGWKMTTPYESRLGVPKMDSIEEALKTCSHVVLVITKEDCEKNDSEQTMTINMAFQSSSEKGLAGRVIPIRCCDEKHLPKKLRGLTNAYVIDANLGDRLKKSINVSVKKRKEEGTSAGSDDSSLYEAPPSKRRSLRIRRQKEVRKR